MVSHHRITRPDAPIHPRWDTSVTEIQADDQFGGSTGSAYGRSHPFATDVQVLTAPELDDLNDLDEESPWLLIAPGSAPRAARPTTRYSVDRAVVNARGSVTGRPATSGTHRAPRPIRPGTSDAAGAVHCRLLIAAIAAGAVAAGANAALDASQERVDPVLLADTTAPRWYLPQERSGIQIVSVASIVDSVVHDEELANATAFAQERAQREARLQRPQFVFPARGIMTSGFGTRWGTLHGGLDVANAIGTPVYAASDGEVVAAGPTPGYGMWVKIRDSAGTVTLYGHIDTATVQTGDRVLAGDQIATMGNRGNSTGPHLHFEVHLGGSEKTDPMPWLRERGVPSN
ncbi:M23 family metallopeptidase [Mycobacterium antarcticum]|uniref:M23 family metallopeptidase n=1 Tax=unclassified Mycolicibacterium TaxID=2636767 RepID=UPI00238A43D3|nr:MULTISPECIES: M23 family metallopeptidase [unclassified Mycolicibacterium]GLP84106.1 membrane protein [Mycolicibacterium sp. TUM20984]